MSTKFGLLVDFDIRKTVMSTNMKPEVVLSRRGCSFEIEERHYSAAGGPIWAKAKCDRLLQNNMLIAIVGLWSKSKPEEEYFFQNRK